jgi:hypothetical protein
MGFMQALIRSMVAYHFHEAFWDLMVDLMLSSPGNSGQILLLP